MDRGQELAIRVLQMAWNQERSAQELADALGQPYLDIVDAIEFLQETRLLVAEPQAPSLGTALRFRITLDGASWLDSVLEQRALADAPMP